jgi:hypothetical protein
MLMLTSVQLGCLALVKARRSNGILNLQPPLSPTNPIGGWNPLARHDPQLSCSARRLTNTWLHPESNGPWSCCGNQNRGKPNLNSSSLLEEDDFQSRGATKKGAKAPCGSPAPRQTKSST